VTRQSAVILAGHGSLLAESGVAMMQIAEALRNRRLAPWVGAGFLNFSQPTVSQIVAQAAASGAKRMIIVPYFLIQGHYVTHELKQLLDSLRTDYLGCEFALAHVLGDHPALVALANCRVQTVDPEPTTNRALLVVAHGTPLGEANAPILHVMQRLQQQCGYAAASIGYLDCNEPTIPAAFAQLAAQSVERIVVLPYFLHLGRHVRRDLPNLFAQARATYLHIDIRIAQHLDYDPLLVDVVADRLQVHL
jgi:sirohydrochlorin ferrochelatase